MPQTKADPVVPPLPKETVLVCSVFPTAAFNQVRPYGGPYEIDPCPPCADHGRAPCELCDNYAALEIPAKLDPIDFPDAPDGSKRRFEIVLAKDIAEDITQDMRGKGVFIAAGPVPTRAEIADARDKYIAFAELKVKQNDDLWNRYGKREFLDPHGVIAARYLGHKREWLSETKPRADCWQCGTPVKSGVVVCAACRAPINWEVARTLGMVTPEAEAYAIANGFLDARETVKVGASVQFKEPSDDALIDAYATRADAERADKRAAASEKMKAIWAERKAKEQGA